MSNCSDPKMQLAWKLFSILGFSRCFTALSVQCKLRSSSLRSSFSSSQPLLDNWRSCKGAHSETLRLAGMGDTCLGSTTPGTCHPRGLGDQVFDIVLSSLEADVVPPQVGEPAMVGNTAKEKPGYHQHSPALASTLDPPLKTSSPGSEALETQSVRQ